MISIYSSAHHVIQNAFDYWGAIDNFLQFINGQGEVVIAVNTSLDGTLEAIRNYSSHIKIVETNFSYNDPWLDGKIKNAALQATSFPLKLGVDLDEKLNPWQLDKWLEWGQFLLESKEYQALLIPSVNLFKDEDHHYTPLGFKWYLHKEGLQRCPVIWARNSDGTVDTNKSDGCEICLPDGNLAPYLKISLNDLYVFHEGYLNLEERVLRNKNFWRRNWSVEAGRPVEIPVTVEEIERGKIVKKHNLRFWREKS